jgi:hypothetical protein
MKALGMGSFSVLFLLSNVLLLGGCGLNTQASNDPNTADSKPGLLARIFVTTKPYLFRRARN